MFDGTLHERKYINYLNRIYEGDSIDVFDIDEDDRLKPLEISSNPQEK